MRSRQEDTMAERTLGVLLYPGFELLDVFGPLEAFGNLPGAIDVKMIAAKAGPVVSAQGPRAVADHGFADAPPLEMILVPGGIGTRDAIDDRALLDWLATRAQSAEIVMSVCTGTALLARAGLLDGQRATTNKAFFQWVADQGPKVEWVREARWVDAGKFVTSSGVSAGIDMALAVVARVAGRDLAENLARMMEYQWHTDADVDPFAKVWGLA
jgi:transcriptional regulator GlxA family with amidase domain